MRAVTKKKIKLNSKEMEVLNKIIRIPYKEITKKGGLGSTVSGTGK